MQNPSRAQVVPRSAASPRRRWRYAATACAALLLFSGCSESPKPAPLEPATQAASATPSETPTPAAAPTLPDAAKGTSKKAAVAFVRHWISALNRAAATGKVASLRALADPSCEVCGIINRSISAVYNAGGSLDGDGWTAQDIQYLALQPRTAPVLRVTVTIAPQVAIKEAGAPAQRFKGANVLYTFHLRPAQDSWAVMRLERAT
jgi:hypothetical protein